MGAVVGMAAALIPDIDHPGSYAGRILRPLAVLIEKNFGHRDSPTHTLLFCILVGFLLGLPVVIYTGSIFMLFSGLLGAISHLVLDGMTKSGVQPFRLYLPKVYMKYIEHVTWTQKRWRGSVTTGKDKREMFITASAILLTVLIIFLSIN